MIKKGDKLLCIGGRDLLELTTGKTYTATSDEIAGIFADRPFIEVTNDEGTTSTCHLSRFERA